MSSLRKYYVLTKEDLKNISFYRELINSSDLESKELGISLALEDFGECYLNFNSIDNLRQFASKNYLSRVINVDAILYLYTAYGVVYYDDNSLFISRRKKTNSKNT